jgi:hypothetical protein
MAFFGGTNLYKKGDEAKQQFVEDILLYICKGYKAFSNSKHILMHMLVL